VGAEVVAPGRVHVRIWAPEARTLELVIAERSVTMAQEDGGYWSVDTDGAAGDRYAFRINGDEKLYPDPVSRFQPDGPHGRSAIVDPSAFEWHDGEWTGITMEGQVVYELHVGTFTREGTYAAAARELRELRDLGITVIELMPVAEFDGRFGWGYDGVDLFAPFHHYGSPDDLRAFVDGAPASDDVTLMLVRRLPA